MSFTVLRNEAYNFISMGHFTVTGENNVGIDFVLI